MFKKNKWQTWYDNLPDNTKAYLKTQPVWHDKDVAFFVSVALVIGWAIGYLVR